MIASVLAMASLSYAAPAFAQTDITSQIVSNQNVTLSGNAVINLPVGTTDYTATNGISGQGTLTIAGNGTLVLNQANSFTLPTVGEAVTDGPGYYGPSGYYSYEGYVASGFLGQYTITHNPDPPAVVIGAGVTLELDDGGNILNSDQGINLDNIEDNGLLLVNGSSSNPTLGIVSGTGAVRILNGTATMLGVNTFTGALIIENNMTLFLGLSNAPGSAPDASSIFNNGTLIVDTPIDQSMTVAQNVYENHFGNDINVDGNGGLIELSGVYSYTDNGNEFNPNLGAPADNYVFLGGNASGRGVNIEGGIAQFGDGNSTNFLLPGNPFNTYITLHPNFYQDKGNGAILIFDYANTGPTYVNTTIAGGGITFSSFNPQGYGASRYGLPNAAGLGTVIFHQGHLVVTQQQYYNGTTQIDAGATLQLGDGTGGDKTTLSNGTIYETSGGDGDIMQAGQTVTVGKTQGTNQGTDTSTGFSNTTLTFTQGSSTVSYTITDKTINNGSIIVDNVGATEFTNLSGSGSLQQSGAGTTTLLANTPYTGATTITGGTLALGAGSSIASSASVSLLSSSQSSAYGPQDREDPSIVAAGGALSTIVTPGVAVFDISEAGNQTIQNLSGVAGTTVALGSNALTVDIASSTQFDGAIVDGGIAGGSGGSLIKTGSGTLELGGDNTYTGSTSIDAGSLQVDGSIAGAVQVDAATVLSGAGQVGSVVVDGTLQPGAIAGAEANFRVLRNASFAAGSIFSVAIDPNGGHSLLEVGGVASLLGGEVKLSAASGQYKAGQDYQILAAAGGVSGTFAGLLISGLSASPTLQYTANAVYLDFPGSTTSTGTTTTSPSSGTTVTAVPPVSCTALSLNECNVKQAVQVIAAASPSGAFASLLANLNDAPLSAERSELDSLDGEIYADTDTLALQQINDLQSWIDPLAAADDQTVWAHYVDDDLRFSGNGNATSLTGHEDGAYLGAQADVVDALRVGAFLGHLLTTADRTGQGDNTRLSGLQGGVYLFTHSDTDAWYGNIVLGAGNPRVQVQRYVQAGGTASYAGASYHQHSEGVAAEAGHNTNVAGWNLRSFVGYDGAVTRHGDIQELGSNATDLDVRRASATWSSATLGLSASHVYTLSDSGTTLAPDFTASLQKRFKDQPQSVDASMQGAQDTSFHGDGVPIGHTQAGVQGGLKLAYARGPSLSVDLGYARSQHESVRSVGAKLAWAW